MASTFGATDLLSIETTGVHLVDNSGLNEDSQNAQCGNDKGGVEEETIFALKHTLSSTYRIDRDATLDIADLGSQLAATYLLLGGTITFSQSGDTGATVTLNTRDVPAAWTADRLFDTGLTVPGGPGIPTWVSNGPLATVVAGKLTGLSLTFGVNSDFDGLDNDGDIVAVEVAGARISVTATMMNCAGVPSLTWDNNYTDESKDEKRETNSGYPEYTFKAFRNINATP